jgi:hypothetical protein
MHGDSSIFRGIGLKTWWIDNKKVSYGEFKQHMENQNKMKWGELLNCTNFFVHGKKVDNTIFNMTGQDWTERGITYDLEILGPNAYLSIPEDCEKSQLERDRTASTCDPSTFPKDLIEKQMHVSSTGGKKELKNERFDLIDTPFLRELSKVCNFGAVIKGYGEDNWRKGFEFKHSIAAMQRHLHCFIENHDRDEESGLHHLAHAAWHCMVLMEYSSNAKYKQFDTRIKD